MPPGLTRLPRPGELFVSPALRELLRTPDGRRVLAPRLPGRVAGEIGPSGLLGPGELGFYAGARDLRPGGPVQRIDRFGDPGRGPAARSRARAAGRDRARRAADPGRRGRRRGGADGRRGPRPAARGAAADRRRRSGWRAGSPPARRSSARRFGLVLGRRALRRRARAASSGMQLPGLQRLRRRRAPDAAARRARRARRARPRRSPSRWSRCGAWSPSRSASSGAPRPGGRAGCGGGSCCPLAGLAALLPHDRAGRGRA